LPQNHSKFGTLTELNEKVVTCELCPNLRRYCTLVAKKKRRQFMDWEYWGKPLPGFGDPQARLLILGLAPAAHGGNRTGRMFTGDGSVEFLMAALHKFGFANKPNSQNVNDGLQLRDAYITAIVRCAPPRNRPKPVEIEKCKQYWTAELRLLSRVRVVMTLGRVAFDTYVRFLRGKGLDARGLIFHHAAFYRLPEPYPALSASYHPSRQNTQTGKLTVKMLDRVFREVQGFLAPAPSNVL
jgi:uracil-DNA glycosylase family 4